MNKLVKILPKVLPILLFVLVTLVFVSPVFAKDIGGVVVSPDIQASGASNITTIGNKIMGIIQVLGTVVAVVILMVLGIKYMLGSAEEKSEYKKTFIPYIVGAILIFAATAIASMVYNWAQAVAK